MCEPITPERLAQLRAVAESATVRWAGDWDAAPVDEDGAIWIETVSDGGYPICAFDGRPECAEHVATFDPTTVRLILNTLERLWTALEWYADPATYDLDALGRYSAVDRDHGDRARAALAGATTEGER